MRRATDYYPYIYNVAPPVDSGSLRRWLSLGSRSPDGWVTVRPSGRPKETILAGHSTTQATLYLSAWVLQPYVDLDRLELLLVAVAAESDPQTALLQSPMRSPAARSPGKPR